MSIRHFAATIAASTIIWGGSAGATGPDSVNLTWMSIANWYFELGDTRIVMDGYITRVPGPPFFVASRQFPADIYATTQGPYGIDTPSISRVWDALSTNGKVKFVIAGHSHFDHTWDTPTWSKLTNGLIIGGLSTCFQAIAQGIPEAKCKIVDGGERIRLADGVTMRIVRFNHSGNSSNPIQHNPRELAGPPVPDAITGGYRAGVGEDYPNGGGGRAFLFTIDNAKGRLSFFVNNSASDTDLNSPIIVDGINYGAPLANLKAAMADAGLTSVDAWIGTGGRAVAQLVVPAIHPKVYIPNHWDGLFNSFWAGMPFPYVDNQLRTYLASQSVTLLPQLQYFDKYRLDSTGVSIVPNHDIKQKLGFSDFQVFSSNLLNAVAQVDSTSIGDDCGESTQLSEWARSPYASNMTLPASYIGSQFSMLTPWVTGFARSRTGIAVVE